MQAAAKVARLRIDPRTASSSTLNAPDRVNFHSYCSYRSIKLVSPLPSPTLAWLDILIIFSGKASSTLGRARRAIRGTRPAYVTFNVSNGNSRTWVDGWRNTRESLSFHVAGLRCSIHTHTHIHPYTQLCIVNSPPWSLPTSPAYSPIRISFPRSTVE